jgi:TPR repeat protein
MKRRITTFLASGLFAFTLFGVAAAGPLEDGTAAYHRRDYAEAMRLLRPLALEGNADAQFKVGVMYDQGWGVPQDYAQALVWFREAAQQGNVGAEFNLGVMYATGRGVARDETEAALWYYNAAEQGNAAAQINLGAMYHTGHGVPQDDAQAVIWYRKAASQGNATAQNNPGLMYRNGQGALREAPAVAVDAAGAEAEKRHGWVMLKRGDDLKTFDRCEGSDQPPPADVYEGIKKLGMTAEISDKGDEVDVLWCKEATLLCGVLGEEKEARFFRTSAACQVAAKTNRDAAAAAAAGAEKRKLESNH